MIFETAMAVTQHPSGAHKPNPRMISQQDLPPLHQPPSTGVGRSIVYTRLINVASNVKRDVRQTPKQRCRRYRPGRHISPATLKRARGTAATLNGGGTRGAVTPSAKWPEGRPPSGSAAPRTPWPGGCGAGGREPRSPKGPKGNSCNLCVMEANRM